MLRRHHENRFYRRESVFILILTLTSIGPTVCYLWLAHWAAFPRYFDGILALDRAHLFHAESVAQGAIAKDAVVDDPAISVPIDTAFEFAGFGWILRGRWTSRTALTFA